MRQVAITIRMLCAVVAFFTVPCERSEARRMPLPRRHKFEIDAATPLKELLPRVPKIAAPAYLTEDLTQIPELMFGEPISQDEKDTEKATAFIVAKINHLNAKEPDGFMKALLANRGDLRGLPFLMGKACRTETKSAQLFAETVAHIQAQMVGDDAAGVGKFWHGYEERLTDMAKNKDQFQHRLRARRDEFERAQIAAFSQMWGPRSPSYRESLAKHLATIKQAEAARSLASLALFAPEASVRAEAVKGLQSHTAQDYQEPLMRGFAYPLPEVSQRAAHALVKLEAKAVLRDLVKVLEQPDPRAPVQQQVDGKNTTVVRELVRVNHHRNCLLCHAPANTEGVPRDIVTAPVPLPDQEFMSSPRGGYGFGASPDIFVRVDMTYLRQDFSMMMKVDNAKPWPEMQRFDFFVRTRVLTAQESAAYAAQIAKLDTPPSHAAAQHALRALTGQTPTDATPQGWRRLLGI
jgi:hypothetical protein